jgi:hypothetical protein
MPQRPIVGKKFQNMLEILREADNKACDLVQMSKLYAGLSSALLIPMNKQTKPSCRAEGIHQKDKGNFRGWMQT